MIKSDQPPVFNKMSKLPLIISNFSAKISQPPSRIIKITQARIAISELFGDIRFTAVNVRDTSKSVCQMTVSK